ncbi:MAG: hypothetical protein K0U64_04900 [Actinomycetia bacterium]|nr:hypothetical protein [Actinomycetes bacterium]
MTKPTDVGHICVIAWAYPPSSATGSLRAIALSRWLLDRGHTVTVLMANPIAYEAFFQTDPSLQAHVPAAVQVVQADFTPESLNPILSMWPERRIRNNRRWGQKWADKEKEAFPESLYPAWIPNATAALFDIHAGNPIELVIATAAPYTSYAVAANFAETTRVPVILDDRDSFLHDVFTGEPLEDYPARHRLFEDYLDWVAGYWCVNDEITEAMRSETATNKDKIITVPNGWDDYALPTPTAKPALATEAALTTKTDATAPRFADRQGPVFLFVGTVTPNFPATEIAAAWSGFRDSIPNARLLIAGGIGYRRAKRTPASIALEGTAGIELLGRVPRAELSAAYAAADGLLFAKEGGPMVTSSKIYEYIATGLPIAALGAPDMGARTVVGDYPRVYWGDLADPVSGARAFMAATTDAASQPPLSNHAESVQHFNRAVTFEREAGHVIDSVVIR